jgi:hypothetical protein
MNDLQCVSSAPSITHMTTTTNKTAKQIQVGDILGLCYQILTVTKEFEGEEYTTYAMDKNGKFIADPTAPMIAAASWAKKDMVAAARVIAKEMVKDAYDSHAVITLEGGKQVVIRSDASKYVTVAG